MAKLLKKDECKAFATLPELKDFIGNQEKSYKWTLFYTKEGKYYPLDDCPIMVNSIREDLGISEEVTNETLEDQMTDTKLVLKFPLTEKMACYPVGPTAYRSILERIGASCSSMTNSRTEIPASAKAQVCNTLAEYYDGKSLALIGDELLLAAHSADYVILPFSELINITEDELMDTFEYVEFKNGIVSHETSSCQFSFEDDEVKSNLVEAFKKRSFSVEGWEMRIKIISSNVGLSGANIYPFICNGKKTISIGTPIKLEHKGTADVEKFKNNLKSSFASFRDISVQLEKMYAIKIEHPADTLWNIGKKIVLPEKYLKEVYNEFKSEYPYVCQGTEIFFRLFDVLDKYTEDAKATDLRIMQLNENITRICFYNIKKFDEPVVK